MRSFDSSPRTNDESIGQSLFRRSFRFCPSISTAGIPQIRWVHTIQTPIKQRNSTRLLGELPPLKRTVANPSARPLAGRLLTDVAESQA